MAGARLGPALWHVQQLFQEGSVTGLSDTQLLRRFAALRDEGAFASLLLRHGPMVLGVCRGILRDSSDVEDAFQATFLVLARKAGSAWGEGQLGGWLHKVAYRIAVRASMNAGKRRQHERYAAIDATVAYTHREFEDDLRPALHEEIARLPAKLRLPVVLCYLEGQTHAQAAVALACGEATLRRRLAAARERLRIRLSKRGLAPAAVIMSATLTGEASAGLPVSYLRTTTSAAIRIAAGDALGNVAITRVAGLVHKELRMSSIGWWKMATVAAVCLTTASGLVGAFSVSDDQKPAPLTSSGKSSLSVPTDKIVQAASAPASPLAASALANSDAQIAWPLTLAQALRLALENASDVRVVSLGSADLPAGGSERIQRKDPQTDRQARHAATVIMPVDPKESVSQFKSHVMAKLRAVEECYLNLSQAHSQLWATEQAVNMIQAVLSRAQADLTKGRGTIADVAETAQRLEQFNLDMVTRTSDVITTERQLRKNLGLALADNRRIVPASPLLEAQFEPDWKTSLAEMNDQQPDIAEIKLAIANRSSESVPGTTDRQLEMLKRDLNESIREKTHTLEAYALGIQSNYKHFKTASRLRAAAAQRLDAQRAYYEEGRITIDRFLDAVSQYATAVATEAEYKTIYNVTICMFEKAKGTLLANDNIIIAEASRPSAVHEQTMTPASPTAVAPSPARAETAVVSKTPSSEPLALPAPPTPLAPVIAGIPAPIAVALSPARAETAVVSNTPSSEPLALPAPPAPPTPVIPGIPASPASLPPAQASEADLEVGIRHRVLGVDKDKTAAPPPQADPSGKTAPRVWSFSLSIGRDRPFIIKGTITEAADSGPGAAER
jgi:RNA polymerase sigma factor (sigma-70 family)